MTEPSTDSAIDPANPDLQELAFRLADTTPDLIDDTVQQLADDRLLNLISAACDYPKLFIRACAHALHKHLIDITGLYAAHNTVPSVIVQILATDLLTDDDRRHATRTLDGDHLADLLNHAYDQALTNLTITLAKEGEIRARSEQAGLDRAERSLADHDHPPGYEESIEHEETHAEMERLLRRSYESAVDARDIQRASAAVSGARARVNHRTERIEFWRSRNVTDDTFDKYTEIPVNRRQYYVARLADIIATPDNELPHFLTDYTDEQLDEVILVATVHSEDPGLSEAPAKLLKLKDYRRQMNTYFG